MPLDNHHGSPWVIKQESSKDKIHEWFRDPETRHISVSGKVNPASNEYGFVVSGVISAGKEQLSLTLAMLGNIVHVWIRSLSPVPSVGEDMAYLSILSRVGQCCALAVHTGLSIMKKASLLIGREIKNTRSGLPRRRSERACFFQIRCCCTSMSSFDGGVCAGIA